MFIELCNKDSRKVKSPAPIKLNTDDPYNPLLEIDSYELSKQLSGAPNPRESFDLMFIPRATKRYGKKVEVDMPYTGEKFKKSIIKAIKTNLDNATANQQNPLSILYGQNLESEKATSPLVYGALLSIAANLANVDPPASYIPIAIGGAWFLSNSRSSYKPQDNFKSDFIRVKDNMQQTIAEKRLKFKKRKGQKNTDDVLDNINSQIQQIDMRQIIETMYSEITSKHGEPDRFYTPEVIYKSHSSGIYPDSRETQAKITAHTPIIIITQDEYTINTTPRHEFIIRENQTDQIINSYTEPIEMYLSLKETGSNDIPQEIIQNAKDSSMLYRFSILKEHPTQETHSELILKAKVGANEQFLDFTKVIQKALNELDTMSVEYTPVIFDGTKFIEPNTLQ